MQGSFVTLLICGAISAFPLSAMAAVGQSSDKPLPTSERPVKPEKNPPGDIPDSQVFIVYHSPLGFSLKVPEGWARRDAASGATFSDKYNTISVAVQARADPLTVANVKAKELAELEKTGKAVRLSTVRQVKLPSGNAIAISYASNSEPNTVTGKAIRLENEQYLFWKGEKLATLTLSAPFGADNADQWTLMAKSFRWR